MNDLQAIRRWSTPAFWTPLFSDRSTAERVATHFGNMPPILRASIVPTFISMVEAVQSGHLITKTTPGSVRSIPESDARIKDYLKEVAPRYSFYSEIGSAAIKEGTHGVAIMCAGMAEGFGGIAKAVVEAVKEARITESGEALSYLDLAFQDLSSIQQEQKGYVPIILPVSDQSRDEVIRNAKEFARKMGIKLFLIDEFANRSYTEKTCEKFRQEKPGKALLVKIVRQPSVLYLSEDGKSVGSPYMKGHGDMAEVFRIQAKDFIELTGMETLQIRNIDNTGATLNMAILGLLIEENKNNNREAMGEVAPKFEGDKGGTPALLTDPESGVERLIIWEQPQVPDEELATYFALSTYGDFNTNTLWAMTRPLITRPSPFLLPFMQSKFIERGGVKYRKLETIIGHLFFYLSGFALRIDRGERFIPAKDLFDLYWGRTNAFMLSGRRVSPVKVNGEWLIKPLGAFSKSVFPDVPALNHSIFNYGSYDATREAYSFIIGGEGSNFNSVRDCSFKTRCALDLRGNVVVIFRGAGGKVRIIGSGENDTITLENTVIIVNPGEERIVTSSMIGQVPSEINLGLLSETLDAAGPRWTANSKEKIIVELLAQKHKR